MPEIRYAGYMATMLLFRRIYASVLSDIRIFDSQFIPVSHNKQDAVGLKNPYIQFSRQTFAQKFR